MCRKSGGHCVEFGGQEAWSRHAPLPPPEWIVEDVRRLGAAASLAATGDVPGALQIFERLRESDSRGWFVDHAQISFAHRRRVLRVARPGATIQGRRLRTPEAIRRRVWERDSYICRYCNLPTIPDDVRAAVRRVVGESVLPWGDTNASRHGTALVARTEYDHVYPASLGGTNDESNLVTSCAGCNYGKDRWTLVELGLDDPRDRDAGPSDWDGLVSLLPALNRLPDGPKAGE